MRQDFVCQHQVVFTDIFFLELNSVVVYIEQYDT